MLHAIPRISEAELAGRNSGLETVASDLRVFNIVSLLDYSCFRSTTKHHSRIYY